MFPPFIYTCDLSIGVHQESMNYIKEQNLEERVSKLAWAYYSLGNAIPQTFDSFWSGHFFPYTESWDELQISFCLSLFGLYKQAMASLRSGLELGLLSVYWNLNDDGHIAVKQWLRAEEDTPALIEIWNRIERHENFRLFQSKYDIKARLLKLRFLHNYVHSKGHKYSNYMGIESSNFQTFKPKIFMLWLDTFEEVIRVLCILHCVKYGTATIRYDYYAKFGVDIPSFGGLPTFEIERLEDIIGKDIFHQIEEVAREDQRVKDIMSWLNSLPEMTEEDVENQIIELDKDMIQRIGLNKWLKQETERLKQFGASEKVQQRIECLTKWAKERGY